MPAHKAGPRRVLLTQKFGGLAGAQVSLIQHLECLNRRHFDPRVLVATEGWLTERLDKLKIPWALFPFGHWNLLSLPKNLMLILRLARYCRRHRIDLVHANEHWVAPQSYWAARLAGIPAIAHFRTGLEDLTARRVRKYLYARFDRVLVVADVLRLEMARHVADPRKLVTIRDGVESRAGSPRYKFCRGRTFVIVIGSIRRIKGQLKILEGALPWLKANSRHYLVMVGGCTEVDYKNCIEECVRRNNLGRQVLLAGSRDDVARLLGLADALVAYSAVEGVPRVVMEAMLAGRPVIVSDTPGMNEIVIDGKVGRIVEFEDAANPLAQALSDLSANPSHWKNMGRHAHEIAARDFSMHAMSQSIQAVYSEILDGSAKAGAMCASR